MDEIMRDSMNETIQNDEIVEFLDKYYLRALKLSAGFSATREFEWTPLLVLNELSVQAGHVYNTIYKSEAVDEPGRNFTNLGDELSDIFLQIITLAYSLHIDLYNLKSLFSVKEDSWFALPVLLGQLNEAIMEKYGYRFRKTHGKFKTVEQFIEDRLLRLFIVNYRIAQKYHIDINNEFNSMLDDANSFLSHFRSRG